MKQINCTSEGPCGVCGRFMDDCDGHEDVGECGYKQPKWAKKQIFRETGLVEDICKCGIGHPNAEWLKENALETKMYRFEVHGCCGCCDMKDEDWV